MGTGSPTLGMSNVLSELCMMRYALRAHQSTPLEGPSFFLPGQPTACYFLKYILGAAETSEVSRINPLLHPRAVELRGVCIFDTRGHEKRSKSVASGRAVKYNEFRATRGQKAHSSLVFRLRSALTSHIWI